jgi:hypothetical protein
MTPDVLAIYRDHPMSDGDVVVLVEHLKLATEIEGLADHWDPVVRTNLGFVLQEIGASEVQLGIARRDGRLRDRDHLLQLDLEQELGTAGIALHPLIALPAAA